ncbi:MAG: N-acetylmuramoyl-L-alanine amidase [Clostridia bacterium]|nr:N-acetylmuramoyl-L-alanine amidase [Clostridia bacterium]
MSLSTESSTTVSTFATPVSGKTFVIDPGHGGIDAGASSGEAVEKELNLKIANCLRVFIEENGGIVVMTRKTDTNTADPNRKKTVSQKKSDLETRKNLPEKVNADIFISIHMNKFSEEKYKGAQVFCAPSSPESEKLGEFIQASLIKNADPENTRKLKDGKSIYILKDAAIPSVLVECGFLSNKEETSLLMTESYQQKIAWSIFMGITEYLVSK